MLVNEALGFELTLWSGRRDLTHGVSDDYKLGTPALRNYRRTVGHTDSTEAFNLSDGTARTEVRTHYFDDGSSEIYSAAVVPTWEPVSPDTVHDKLMRYGRALTAS